MVLPQPRVVFVQHVVVRCHLSNQTPLKSGGWMRLVRCWRRPHLSPLSHTEDPVGVVAVLPDAVQLDGVTPGFSHILLYRRQTRSGAISGLGAQ